MRFRTVYALALPVWSWLAGAEVSQAQPPAKAQCAANSAAARGPVGPVLFLDQTGIRLIRPERVAQKSASSIESIRSILPALPPQDWPNGCFVALTETGLRSVDGDRDIEHYEQALNQMLKEIGVRVGLITSA